MSLELEGAFPVFNATAEDIPVGALMEPGTFTSGKERVLMVNKPTVDSGEYLCVCVGSSIRPSGRGLASFSDIATILVDPLHNEAAPFYSSYFGHLGSQKDSWYAVPFQVGFRPLSPVFGGLQNCHRTFRGSLTRGVTVVHCATTVAGTLATTFVPGAVIDGFTLAQYNRILVKNQAAPSENAVYIVQASGTPRRDYECQAIRNDTYGEAGITVKVLFGTANGGSIWTTSGAGNFGSSYTGAWAIVYPVPGGSGFTGTVP